MVPPFWRAASTASGEACDWSPPSSDFAEPPHAARTSDEAVRAAVTRTSGRIRRRWLVFMCFLSLCDDGRRYERVHCWLACPLQYQTSTGVPLPVPAPAASRQSSGWPTLVIDRSPWSSHAWLGAPVQSVMITGLPALDPSPPMVMHLSA